MNSVKACTATKGGAGLNSPMKTDITLYYVHDPMCSWCWGFRPVWTRVVSQLKKEISLIYVLGGLAPDTTKLMPPELQARIRNTWRRIQEEIPGSVFNFDFWETCSPRRSTYPSCRAVIAARNQIDDADTRMLLAIQQAYYLQAKNPSDFDVLISLAKTLGLNTDVFSADLNSSETKNQLHREFQLRDRLGVSSFPSIVLTIDDALYPVHIDYTDPDTILQQINDYYTNSAG